jgi:hypothetical protein
MQNVSSVKVSSGAAVFRSIAIRPFERPAIESLWSLAEDTYDLSISFLV